MGAVQLPDNTDTEHVTARVDNGELTVTVPKTETEPREQEVTVT